MVKAIRLFRLLFNMLFCFCSWCMLPWCNTLLELDIIARPTSVLWRRPGYCDASLSFSYQSSTWHSPREMKHSINHAIIMRVLPQRRRFVHSSIWWVLNYISVYSTVIDIRNKHIEWQCSPILHTLSFTKLHSCLKIAMDFNSCKILLQREMSSLMYYYTAYYKAILQ